MDMNRQRDDGTICTKISLLVCLHSSGMPCPPGRWLCPFRRYGGKSGGCGAPLQRVRGVNMDQGGTGMLPVENSLEMFFLFDKDGIIFYANAAARDRLEYENGMCGNHISNIFPNEFKKTGEGFSTEYSFGTEVHNLTAYRKNLTCFPVEARIVWEEEHAGYLCMANDILEKEHLSLEIERVKQEAEQALQVRSEFVANVTHELRTPVNGILGNVMELAEKEEDEHKKKTLQLIERCCGDMNRLINNILDFSKLEAGKFVLETRRFHFRNMIDYVRGNHQNKITENTLFEEP